MTTNEFPLDDQAWADLETAYGDASEIPSLLRQLGEGDFANAIAELWSGLCHQGDVYSASLAAFPHLVRIAAARTDEHWIEVIHLASAIEMGRQQQALTADPGYQTAIDGALSLCARRIAEPLPDAWEAVLPAAITSFRGYGQAASLIFQLGEIVENGPDEFPEILLPVFQKA